MGDEMVFAGSIMATRFVTTGVGSGIASVHTVLIIYAESLVEAKAKAHLIALDRWPIKEGWENHTEEVLSIQYERA